MSRLPIAKIAQIVYHAPAKRWLFAGIIVCAIGIGFTPTQSTMLATHAPVTQADSSDNVTVHDPSLVIQRPHIEVTLPGSTEISPEASLSLYGAEKPISTDNHMLIHDPLSNQTDTIPPAVEPTTVTQSDNTVLYQENGESVRLHISVSSSGNADTTIRSKIRIRN